MIIHPVNISAIQGVLRFREMLAKKLGSIRSRPSAYDALVAEYIVAFKAEIEANIAEMLLYHLNDGTTEINISAMACPMIQIEAF